MDLNNQIAVVTGGTRGLGLGIVEELLDKGAKVTVVARHQSGLDDVARRLDVDVIAADVTDQDAAWRILGQVQPSIVVLNAGAPPAMALLEDQRWETFSNTWETDVKAGFHWIQAALGTPLAPGSRVLVSSSGAAVAGSPLSGGYGGAKRMLWLMSNYAQGRSAQRELGIRFQTIVPRQMIAGTGVGGAASAAYSANLGVTVEQYLERFGAPMPPRRYGEHIVSILTDARYERELAFGIKGDTGISILESAAI